MPISCILFLPASHSVLCLASFSSRSYLLGMGSRAFSIIAYKFWNELPSNNHSFFSVSFKRFLTILSFVAFPSYIKKKPRNYYLLIYLCDGRILQYL